MDFLNFVIMIHKTFGVEIPEADYPKYGTLERLRGAVVEQPSDMTLSPLSADQRMLKVLVGSHAQGQAGLEGDKPSGASLSCRGRTCF